MSTIKITQLPALSGIDPNTANTIFIGVDLTSDVTGKLTATTLASGLYSYNPLNVGIPRVTFGNTVAGFTGSSSTYAQVNLENNDSVGSGDYIISGDIGTDSNNFIDLGFNNSNFSDPAYSSMKKLDGYLYVHGSTDTSYDGNLIIGTTSTKANIVMIVGGTTSSNVVGRISATKFDFLKDVSVTGNTSVTGLYKFSDGTTQNTAGISVASAYANDYVTLTTAKTYTDTANTFLQANTGAGIISANTWLKANYLANANNTLFNGTLNIGNKLNVNGSVIFANTNFASTEAALTIAACPQNQIQLPSNDGYMLHISGKQDVPSRIVFDSFGVGTYGLLAGRTSRGTPTTPTATQNGDILLRMSGNGWGTTGYAPLGIAKIDIVATENYTDSTRGSQIQFWNIPNGSNTLTQIAAFNGDSAHFLGSVYPEKGLVYNPRILSGAQTAITISFTNDSVVKANLTADLTFTLNSFLAGKIVDVWLTNSGGAQRTITHGCSAINSTINATTFNIPATSSAYLKYFSLDGDLANTFVTITHA